MVALGKRGFVAMTDRSNRKPDGREQAIPYPVPPSDRCEHLMLSVIKSLGSLPKDDGQIEDRVVALVMTACGELATMQDTRRRDEIVDSLSRLSKRVIERLVRAGRQTTKQAEANGQSVVEMLYDAVDKGTATERPLQKRGSH